MVRVLLLFIAIGSLHAETLPLPKPGEKTGKPDIEDDWTGRTIMTKHPERALLLGAWVDGEEVYWTPRNLMDAVVCEDRGGYLRVFDHHREGWIEKSHCLSMDEAPAYWDRILKMNPDDADVFFLRASAWMNLGEYDRCITDCSDSLRLQPERTCCLTLRGLAWSSKADDDQAISDFNEAIRLDPACPYNFHGRGSSWYRKSDSEKAISDYTQAIRLDPRSPASYLSRGMVLYHSEKINEAIMDANIAIDLDANWADAYAFRGHLRSLKDDTILAIADFHAALRIDPKSRSALRALSWLRSTCRDAKHRNGAEALKLIRKAMPKPGEEGWMDLAYLAAALAETGDFAAALAEQKKALEKLKAEDKVDANDLKYVARSVELYRQKKPWRNGE